ncbi:MAG: hypothetical protein GQ564_11470 [Bacteroidales bacterium]|nr:hypothetical protein [Bacteroidales bacterium]
MVKLENIIFYILLIQISIATMQYFSKNVSDYFKIVEYSWQGNTTITLGDSLIKSKIINGTFFRAANYGNTIAIIIVYFFSQILYGKFKYNKFKIVVLILGIITVLLTGIRTSAGSMVLGMFFVYFFKNKRKALMLLGIVIVLLFTYQQVLVGIGKLGLSQGTIENPFSRLSAALVMFSGDINTIEETTITRSLSIFPYALQNPFFGIGQYYISGYTGIESITDAFLLFHIAEIGIFGLLILLIPHFKVLQRIKKINKQGYYTVLSLFILLLVQTVTDAGLFSHYGMIFFFFLSALIYLKNTLIYEKK